MSSLVVVESPAKAQTLERILGSGYSVEASYGHIRDLPEGADQIPASVKGEAWARLGVNPDDDFEPLYVIPKGKGQHIKKLRAALKNADELLLATDEDREGESISWHVVEVLKPDIPVRRIVFHEITDEAIHRALEEPRDIDQNLVRAQESRRIIDRLFGYELSPLLWKKVKSGLSAGRVQSVAVRLCVLRERERRAFVRSVYWDLEAAFEEEGTQFTARLVRLGEAKLATGKNFDPDTGELKGRSKALWLETEGEATDFVDTWSRPWKVTSVETKPFKRRPAPPFTTSSLQQEAYRKLGFSARHTMSVAQRLYQGVDIGHGERTGLITYMRTDSVHLSRKALADAQQEIRSRFGDAYTDGPRQYKTKSKGAQEAHEAIRPTEMHRHPDDLKRVLRSDELALYDLVWKRALASQMSEARLERTTIEITAPPAENAPDGAAEGVFSTSGTTVKFPGFLRVYEEGSDEPRGRRERDVILPALEEGRSCDPVAIEAKSHETSPPARYTEASLVKKLEAEGIGRPSTYASIIDTIQDRGYVFKQSGSLVPTFTAHAVTQLLESHFPDYVDTEFTARMEQELDDIATGELAWKEQLERFYFGTPDDPGLEKQIEREEPRIEYPAMVLGRHPETEREIVVRIGRYGPYLQMLGDGDDKTTASLPEEMPPAELTMEKAVELLDRAERGSKLLGNHPESGEEIYLMHGRYGPYVQVGETPERGSKQPKPKRASLPKGTAEDDVTLEKALLWLSLPRTLGEHPESGEEVVAATGRYGPFLRCGKETRSLPAEDDIYTVGLERALEVLAQPKRRRGQRASSRTVMKEFGEDGDGNTVQLLDGRYGPYLTNGELNASLPKGTDPKKLTAEEAHRLLSERGKPPKRRRKRTKRSGGKKKRSKTS
ncbi:MAG: type I DNA topoisomerase [Thermoanaerobaculia bacterium]|nr:type I DNA topoisomerase [Thermoanaerobaculia bacterium]